MARTECTGPKVNFQGKIFGMLTVLSLYGKTEGYVSKSGRFFQGKYTWLCRCSCGNETVIDTTNLTKGSIKSCGCLLRREKFNPRGMKFGSLLVMDKAGRDAGKNPLWLCRCDCGNTTIARGNSIKNGRTKTCGCGQAPKSFLGARSHPLYDVYYAMLKRCGNEKDKAYKDYGGRGISVCERWKESFLNFYSDIIPLYVEGLHMDRIDNNGNYEGGNVRFVTQAENNRNKRPYTKRLVA